MSKQSNGAAHTAQIFTMVAAAAYGLWWAIVGIFNWQGHTYDVIGKVILVVLIASGLVMGILYALGGSSKTDK